MKNEKVQISNNKTLKLSNVLIKEIDLQKSGELAKEVFQMDNYLKNKGGKPIGPHIQYSYIDGEHTEDVNRRVLKNLLNM